MKKKFIRDSQNREAQTTNNMQRNVSISLQFIALAPFLLTINSLLITF